MHVFVSHVFAESLQADLGTEILLHPLKYLRTVRVPIFIPMEKYLPTVLC